MHGIRHSFAALRRALGPAAAALLVACGGGGTHWKSMDITGVMPDLRFTLVDDEGRTVTAERYLGKVNLLYFGYTHCPDVCPLTLATIERAFARLGPAADGVRLLFVSVDPSRDGPKILHAYVAAFGAHIVGLTGTQPQLQALTKRYRVSYRYGRRDQNGDYAVYHSAGIYVFDRRGRARLLMTGREGADAIARDLERLLAGAPRTLAPPRERRPSVRASAGACPCPARAPLPGTAPAAG